MDIFKPQYNIVVANRMYFYAIIQKGIIPEQKTLRYSFLFQNQVKVQEQPLLYQRVKINNI